MIYIVIKVVSTSILRVKPSFCSCKGFIHNDIPLWDDLTTLRWFWDNLSLFLTTCSKLQYGQCILLATKTRRVTPISADMYMMRPQQKHLLDHGKLDGPHISGSYLWKSLQKSCKKKHGKLSILQKKNQKKFSLVLWCFNYTPKNGFTCFTSKKKNGGFFPDDFSFSITLPETNIAPENEPLEKEIPIGNHHF